MKLIIDSLYKRKEIMTIFILLFFLSCFDESPLDERALYVQNKKDFLTSFHTVSKPKKRINIIHISDNHIAYGDSRMNLSHAIRMSTEDSLSLKALICTGDLSEGYDSRIKKSTVLNQFNINRLAFSKATIPTLIQLGNHDANDADGVLEVITTKKEQWDNVFIDISEKWTNIQWGDKENFRHYHYYDIQHPSGNIRVIVLDQLDHDMPLDKDSKPIYKCQEEAVYSQRQIDWLCNVALKTPPNTGIVLCNHYPFMKTGTYKGESFLNGASFVQNWQMIPQIIDAWQKNQKINIKHTDIKKTQNIIVNADFTNYSKGCEFITHLAGHIHHKHFGWIDGYNQLYIMETTLGRGQGSFSMIKREPASSSSAAFSILSIDQEEKRIYRTSFGAYIRTDLIENSRIEIIDYRKEK